MLNAGINVRLVPVAEVGIGAGYISRSGSEIAASFLAILRASRLFHFMRSYPCRKPKRKDQTMALTRYIDDYQLSES